MDELFSHEIEQLVTNKNIEWNLTEQAFLNSITDNLHKINTEIVSLHKKSRECTPQLREFVIQQDTKLKLLSSTVERCLGLRQNELRTSRERSCHLLSNLYDIVRSLWLSHRNTNETSSIIWRVFVDTLQPFLKIMKEFLIFGRVTDPFQEFFVQQRPNVIEQYFISTLSDVPNFLQEVCQTLLLGGISQAISHSLKITGSSLLIDSQPDFVYFSPLLWKDIAEIQQTTITLDAIVSEYLIQPIQQFSIETEQNLVQKLINEQNLVGFLKCLHDFYFMKSGDTINWDVFLTAFFNQLDQKSSDFFDNNVVESMLHDALKTQCLSFKISVAGRFQEMLELKFLETMKFTFEIHGALSYVLNDDDVADYSSILIFLFQIARTKHVLDHLHHYSHTKFVHHKLLLLRAKLSHFVNTLQTYVVHRVVKTAWKNFKGNINKQTSISSLRNLHKYFLLTVKENCLLTEKFTTLLHAIVGILNISSKLSQYFISEKRMKSVDVVELDSQFQGSMTLLLAIISKILTQKKVSSLEDLALRLDFNGYYARNKFHN